MQTSKNIIIRKSGFSSKKAQNLKTQSFFKLKHLVKHMIKAFFIKRKNLIEYESMNTNFTN